MADESSHELEHSPIEKAITVGAVTFPLCKSEAAPLPVNTSSQASMEEAEASLECLPANVSPNATACSSRSVSPSVDPTELRTDANMAADHMLHVKRSTDLKRQCVIWELGLLLHQSEVDEVASIEKAKVVHSWEVLDAKVGCARSVLRAKCNYQASVQEAKMIRGNLLQKSEIAYSKAIGKAVVLRSSQTAALHRKHVRLMQELEEQALREESKSHHDFLPPIKQPCIIPHNPSRRIWPPLITPYWGNHLCCLHLFSLPGHPQWKNSHPWLPLPTSAQTFPMAKKAASFARTTGEHVYRQNYPKGYAGRTI